MALLTVGAIALFGVTLMGFYSLHVFAQRNGTFDLIEGFAKRGYLSDGTIYSPKFTGIEVLDTILNLLLQFFWPVVDGKHLDAIVITALFGAQGMAGWALTVTEGMRFDTSRFLTYTTPVGVLVQLLGYGFVNPLYLFIHLLTIIFGGDSASVTHRSVSAPEDLLHAMPWATVCGFVIPSIIMGLPSPQVLNTSAKIGAIFLWQPFPIWSALFVRLFSRNSSTARTNSSPRQTLKAFRKVYRFGFYAASSIHVIALIHGVLSIVSPDTLGVLYSPQLHPAYLYIPKNPFSSIKASTVAEGAFWFLQWDFISMSSSYLIWAACLKYSVLSNISLPTVVYETVLRSLLVGPVASALSLIWERDEYIFAREIKAGGTKKSK